MRGIIEKFGPGNCFRLRVRFAVASPSWHSSVSASSSLIMRAAGNGIPAH